MTFSLRIEQPDAGTQVTVGSIHIDDFSETFQVDLSYWDIGDYLAQWRAGLTRIAEGEVSSCIISSISRPQSANFVFLWLLYRDGGHVFVQQQVLFLDELEGPFDPTEPYRHVPPRVTISDDGDDISEWETSIDAIERFVSAADSGKPA